MLGGGYSAVEGGPGKFMWEKKCMFSGSPPNQTYYLLVCPPLHSLNQLFTVCNSLTCSPCRDLGEHALSLYLWGEGYGADTAANLAPLQTFNTVYSWKRGLFFKGSKNVRIKTELCFFCAALHTHLVHNIQSGRFLRLKALSSAS